MGMTRIYDAGGTVTPVTVVRAGPCAVLQTRTMERDGYHAIQIGLGDLKPHLSTKPLIGHAARAGVGPKRHVREIRLDGPAEVKAGDVLTVEVFSEGVTFVDVVGTSKGHGFSGVMAHYNFAGQCASHGTERKHRSPGSIGGQADRLRGKCVRKGKKMPGHWGAARITSRNLRLMGVDKANDLLLIKGSVPGPTGTLVFVRKAKTRG